MPKLNSIELKQKRKILNWAGKEWAKLKESSKVRIWATIYQTDGRNIGAEYFSNININIVGSSDSKPEFEISSEAIRGNSLN
jgi:hypothetical protein